MNRFFRGLLFALPLSVLLWALIILGGAKVYQWIF